MSHECKSTEKYPGPPPVLCDRGVDAGRWVIDMGGIEGDCEVVVHFCPYCGENLEETKPQIPAPMPLIFCQTTDDQLKHRFLHLQPRVDQLERCSQIRKAACSLAMTIRDVTPVSPEQTRAINAIDEAVMLAHAAIARHVPGTRADSPL